MTEVLTPKDHTEAVALFRLGIIGSFVACRLSRGQLKRELREVAAKHFRPPGAMTSRSYSVPTLERWLYAYRKGGLDALRPQRRRDRGHGRALNDTQRSLIIDIRKEYPAASAELVLETLYQEGRLQRGVVSPATVRRLWAAEGLDGRSSRKRAGGRIRRRWEAAHPGQLWHADVCHGPALRIDGRAVPLRIHAILDDASRYVVALRACHTERESEMLALLTEAVRRHGRCGTLYLDNGSTYSGSSLDTACGRLGIRLVHAQPYDPQARGKMERLWRTLRADLLSHMPTMTRLHDVQVRLLAWLDRYYHVRPHSGLLGRTPQAAWSEHRCDRVSSDELARALTVRGRRRVRRDGTVAVGGVDWECDQGFLHGKLVTIARTLAEPTAKPWIEHESVRYDLQSVDPKANAQRGRKAFQPKGIGRMSVRNRVPRAKNRVEPTSRGPGWRLVGAFSRSLRVRRPSSLGQGGPNPRER